MRATVDRLIALAGAQIAQDTRALLDGGSVTAWERAMERALTQAHTATYLAATSERLNVPIGGALLSERRLSRAERNDIKDAVRTQLQYLRRFAGQQPDMSPRAIAARAAQYATSVRSFYYTQRWGDWDIPDRLLPGMQTCMGNCKCGISVTDSGDGTGVLLRVMGGTEHHCTECPPLAGEHPVTRRRAA